MKTDCTGCFFLKDEACSLHKKTTKLPNHRTFIYGFCGLKSKKEITEADAINKNATVSIAYRGNDYDEIVSFFGGIKSVDFVTEYAVICDNPSFKMSKLIETLQANHPDKKIKSSHVLIPEEFDISEHEFLIQLKNPWFIYPDKNTKDLNEFLLKLNGTLYWKYNNDVLYKYNGLECINKTVFEVVNGNFVESFDDKLSTFDNYLEIVKVL